MERRALEKGVLKDAENLHWLPKPRGQIGTTYLCGCMPWIVLQGTLGYHHDV